MPCALCTRASELKLCSSVENGLHWWIGDSMLRFLVIPSTCIFPKYASSIRVLISIWKNTRSDVRPCARLSGVPRLKKHLHFEKWPSKTRCFLILFAKTSSEIDTFEAKCLKTPWQINVFLWKFNRHYVESLLLNKKRWNTMENQRVVMKIERNL